MNIILSEYKDGVIYTYKYIPAHYLSSFNKLVKVSDKYKLYCIPISEYTEEWNDDCCVEYLKYMLSLTVYNKLLTTTKISHTFV